ncbi:Non-heme dioxygenase N-terminal domain-containing protein [Cynara cardunculus var. scolymus]|uniref:Non-heme dioxygenase N-terminal domain-containing protein n=1 Tax=Cynara cardunculus var. scolymus TaxID=59895 RepID=A0A124SB38_CYNCS|nr:Non-heme dioxygenase N-terminal domain-containing protein [Cynara cardunculus var. scolymus]
MASSSKPLPRCHESLKELAKELKMEVPHRYVQEQREPTFVSSGSLPLPSIPVIDMNDLIKIVLGSDDAVDELNKLRSVCHEWGIFQLVNHGVDKLLVEKMKEAMVEFFQIPEEEKLRYKLKEGEYEGYGQTILHDQDQKLQRLAMTLFHLIGQAVDIDKQEMSDVFEDGMQSVRMTYYPPCPKPDLVIGLTPHSDAAGITILLQVNDIEGLQVKKDGIWIPVNFLPNAFVVNVGDVLEIMSNGAYNSIEHRATVHATKERISLAMFFNPKFQADVGPAKSLLKNTRNPPLYKTLVMEQYLKEFFSGKLNGKTFLKKMKIENEEACET